MIGLWLAVLCTWLTTAMVAQPSPVVMRINGKEILLSEFQYAYDSERMRQKSESPADEFLQTFIDRKLAVWAAEKAGLDTMPVVKNVVEAYRRQLFEKTLAQESVGEDEVRNLYERMATGRRSEAIRVEHLFKRLAQNVPETVLRETVAWMDSIYGRLTESGGQAFDEYVKNYSDEPADFWVRTLQEPEELEDSIWKLQPGEFTSPFFTPRGIHIVKVLERKEIPSYDELKEKILVKRFREKANALFSADDTLLERLQETHHFIPDGQGINQLLRNGKTDQSLFSVDGRMYTGKDFARFATSYPAGVRRQLQAFMLKTLMDSEYAQWGQNDAVSAMQIQACRDSLLLQLIREQEVVRKSTSDEQALQAYFEAHRADYDWENPRYNGIVLHCVNRRTGKRVRKLLKQLPPEEWMDAIRLVFNADGVKVKAEQGSFVRGENAFVDYRLFGGEKPQPVPQYPHTYLWGNLQKGPEHYEEVSEVLIGDYRYYLEKQWLASLRKQAKVEINQEVLKTVNNNGR